MYLDIKQLRNKWKKVLLHVSSISVVINDNFSLRSQKLGEIGKFAEIGVARMAQRSQNQSFKLVSIKSVC